MAEKQDTAASDNPNSNLQALCTDMFSKSAQYLRGELNGK